MLIATIINSVIRTIVDNIRYHSAQNNGTFNPTTLVPAGIVPGAFGNGTFGFPDNRDFCSQTTVMCIQPSTLPGAASEVRHTVGKTISEGTGGKFANGAAYGAFSVAGVAKDVTNRSDSRTVPEGIDPEKVGQRDLDRLREIEGFTELEGTVEKKYGPIEYIFGRNIGGSRALRNAIIVDVAQVGVSRPADLSQMAGPDPSLPDEQYYPALEKFRNTKIRLSIERTIVHELNHGAVGSFSPFVDDTFDVIDATNRFMKTHFNEIPRNPRDPGCR